MSLYLVGGKPINGDLAVFVAITIKQKREKGGGGLFIGNLFVRRHWTGAYKRRGL